ncbi:MAG TPA: PQQ-binding-like beta-propeller repeat protein [Candidatus Acidoferrum sp.]|nr:PQQ-binding-like beta-propeller repeat protein [Candidatus Acidoferrum sp.]
MGRSDAKDVPLNWSDEKNIVWKTALPGPGASSPITLGNRIFITCFTGYATSSREPGDMANLKRHLLCLNFADGKIVWNTPTAAELPEQDRIRESHGYASSTPVADNERIYTFYGKSGVFAFDHSGKQLWRANVGDKLNGWGSATSPVLYKNLLIVNASIESDSLVALDKKTGKEVWRASGASESWHAPVFVAAPDGKDEIVIAKNGRVLGFDPENGASLWSVKTGIPWYMCPTPVAENGIAYVIGGRTPNGALAIRAGGRGDVTASHVVWKLNKGSNVPSPVLHDGHLYFAHENLGIIYCVNSKTGEVVYEERLEPSPGQIYASPVLADGKIYFTGRGGRTVVIAAKPKFERLADNTLESNRGVFNSTPALEPNALLHWRMTRHAALGVGCGAELIELVTHERQPFAVGRPRRHIDRALSAKELGEHFDPAGLKREHPQHYVFVLGMTFHGRFV